jgi:calcineurin-like phosphoesterase family protein
MNSTLFNNWRDRVGKDDIVYHLGDVGFGGQESVIEIMRRLPGRKVLMVGNHDRRIRKNTEFCDKFIEVCIEPKVIKVNGRIITLGHKPKAHVDTAYQIYGHIHNKLIRMDNAFNASVELNGYMPVSFEELVRNNMMFLREFAGTEHIISKDEYFSGEFEHKKRNWK